MMKSKLINSTKLKISIILFLTFTVYAFPFISMAQIRFQKVVPYYDVYPGGHISQLADSSYFIMGHNFNSNGDADAWLQKLSPSGNFVWSVDVNYVGINKFHELKECSGGNLIASGNQGNKLFLTKFNQSGDTIWTKNFYGVGLSGGSAVLQTADSGFLQIGSFYNGDTNISLIKSDSLGNLIWNKYYIFQISMVGKELYFANDGGYYLTGIKINQNEVCIIKLDSIFNPVWSKVYEKSKVCKQTPDGGFIMIGEVDNFVAGFSIKKTNTAGDTLWTKCYVYNGALSTLPLDIVQTRDKGYVITGTSGGDVYLMKCDSLGNVQWSRTYDSGNQVIEMGYSVIESSDGGFLVAGILDFSWPDANDLYLIKTDSLGYSGCPDNSGPPLVFSYPLSISSLNFSAVDSTYLASHALQYVNFGGIYAVPSICTSTNFIPLSAADLNTLIYPNPVSDYLHISLEEQGQATVTIKNTLGVLMCSNETVSIGNSQTEVVDVSAFPDGIYIVEIRTQNRSFIHKIVKCGR